MHRITRSKSTGDYSARSASQSTGINASSRPSRSEPLSPSKQLHEDSLEVLKLIDSLGLDLGKFIHGIFYGNSESRDNLAMRKARGSFIQSDLFSSFLRNLYKPPRPPNGKGQMPTAARRKLLDFSAETMRSVFANELSVFSETYTLSDEELVSPDELAKFTSTSLWETIKKQCKYLTETLESLTGDQEALEDETAGSEGDLPPINRHPHFVRTQTGLCWSY